MIPSPPLLSMIPSASFCTRVTDYNDDRIRQINTLKVFNDNVSEITPNSEYSIEFVAGENKLAMLIILGPDFPSEKPLLKITPSISHQWVNENSEIVGAPGYLNFCIYSDLGRVVQVIIRELQRNPPPLKQKESPITASCRFKNLDVLEASPCSEEFEQSFEVMSSVVGRLHKMSVEELKKLNEDEEDLEKFVSNLPHVQSLKQTVIDLINGTEELEKKNVELEQKIEELKTENDNKKPIFEEHRDKCKELYDKYMKLAEIRAPVNVKKRLKQAATTLDTESETVADKFLEGELPLDQFLSKYKQLRIQLHAIKKKEERIDKRIQMDKNTTS
ncbi:vacuolar protein sorting-associated protein 37A-like [Planococcus citri]|uniref:vacuolar protein sorting-associated protein 37A-like n=1 Tax=Planococcus citri TaxID=170843 RepID=UPI0031F8E1E9